MHLSKTEHSPRIQRSVSLGAVTDLSQDPWHHLPHFLEPGVWVQYPPPSGPSVSQIPGAFAVEDLITQAGRRLGADLHLANLLSILSRGFSKPTCPTVLVCLLKL